MMFANRTLRGLPAKIPPPSPPLISLPLLSLSHLADADDDNDCRDDNGADTWVPPPAATTTPPRSTAG
uniref:Uncharacterized protein n=1 Tax=Oryza sativa subsp. japonica TaxID=39947 RepID=Q6K415_ORYSJ|nr:hypothetical protein [Oryza sativa Japonica Group]